VETVARAAAVAGANVAAVTSLPLSDWSNALATAPATDAA
jgi:hypothetical protein